LNCKGVIREISNYIDGELDAAMMRDLQQHLHDCVDCALVVNQTKLTVELYCDSETVELPPDIRTRLHEAFRKKFLTPGS
jgi:anti-sigma factor RsiW